MDIEWKGDIEVRFNRSHYYISCCTLTTSDHVCYIIYIRCRTPCATGMMLICSVLYTVAKFLMPVGCWGAEMWCSDNSKAFNFLLCECCWEWKQWSKMLANLLWESKGKPCSRMIGSDWSVITATEQILALLLGEHTVHIRHVCANA